MEGRNGEGSTGAMEDDVLRNMAAAFLAMEPPQHIVKLARIAGGGLISEYVQNFFIRNCVENVVCRKYPPSELYVSKVLKQIILAAESDGQEVLHELYMQHGLYLVSLKDRGTPWEIADRCYRSYVYTFSTDAISKLIDILGKEGASHLNDLVLTVRVSLNMLGGDTGLCTWPAGLFLSEFLLSHPQIFFGKSCLELGSGAGLPGMCLAQLKPSKVVLTDGNSSTLSNLRHNLLINGIQKFGEVEVECQELIWEAASQDELAIFGAEIIIGADLIYDPSCIPHLMQVLIKLLSKKVSSARAMPHLEWVDSEVFGETSKKKGMNFRNPNRSNNNEGVFPIAFLATAIRNIDTLHLFLSLAQKSGIDIQDVTQSMKPFILLPNLSSFDRCTILMHRLSIV